MVSGRCKSGGSNRQHARQTTEHDHGGINELASTREVTWTRRALLATQRTIVIHQSSIDLRIPCDYSVLSTQSNLSTCTIDIISTADTMNIDYECELNDTYSAWGKSKNDQNLHTYRFCTEAQPDISFLNMH